MFFSLYRCYPLFAHICSSSVAHALKLRRAAEFMTVDRKERRSERTYASLNRSFNFQCNNEMFCCCFFASGLLFVQKKSTITTSKRAAPNARAFWFALWRENIIMRELGIEQCEFHVYCTSFRFPTNEIPFLFTRLFFFQYVKSTHPQTRALNEVLLIVFNFYSSLLSFA